MPFDLARPGPDDPALLYSLAEFAEVIFAAFEAAGVRTVAEVGAEGGTFTRRLVEWVTGREGHLFSIDPAPGPGVRALAEDPAMTLLEERSHDALARLDPCDAYLLDGDHNYFTVTGELDLIAATAERSGRWPLLVLQDVAWPSGRRDQYYAPDSLPPNAVHPHDFGGVVPWSATTVRGGFRGDGQFAFATVEGGPGNGVLTGLEDFLARAPGWEVISVPAVFGLSLVFRADQGWAPAVRAAVGPLADHPLLARLEANRVLLYLRLLDAQDELERRRLDAAERIAALEAEVDTLRATLDTAREAQRAAELAAARLEVAPPPPPPPDRPTLLRSALSAVRPR